MGSEGFMWFLGIVEDLADPLKLGRVRVRIFNEHDAGIDTTDLPWATAMMPITSASIKGVGVSPTGLSIGSYVYGFYMDGGEKQLPAVTHTWHTIPKMEEAQHGVPSLARGKKNSHDDKVGPEPDSPFAGQYPFNHVMQTAGGHVVEVDDTPGEERLHIRHASGSYVEINKEGRMVTKTVGDDYKIVVKDETVYVKGNVTINVDGNETVTIKGNANISVEGSATVSSQGAMSLSSDGVVNISGSRVNIN